MMGSKGSGKQFQIRKVSIKLDANEEKPQEERKKIFIPVHVLQEKIEKEVVEIYQKMSYIKPALPRTKEGSKSVGPQRRKKGIQDLVNEFWKLDSEYMEKMKKPPVPLGKEHFTRQK